MGVPELSFIQRKWKREEEERGERKRKKKGEGGEEEQEGGGGEKLSHLLNVLSFLNFTSCSIHSDIASLSLLKPAQRNLLPMLSLERVLSVPASLFYLIFLYPLSTSPVKLCRGPLDKPDFPS